jgi:radical SAM protein with 4Fe4S-binding SPASM domain
VTDVGSPHYTFPEKVYTSVRGSATLYFAADRGSAVVVNEAGRDILEACRQGGTEAEVARRLTRDRPFLVPHLRKLIRPFLADMVGRRFLASGPALPLTADRPAPAPGPVQLNQLYLSLTDACNLRCLYCYNLRERTRRRLAGRQAQPELTGARIRRVLEEAADLGVKEVVCTGGEPLCRKEAVELAAYGKELGLSMALLTNGTLIDPARAREIAAGFDSVVVSLDSCVKEEYERLRPGAPFEQAVQGVQNLAAAGLTALFIRPVLTRHNLASLPQFPRFAAEHLGCTNFMPTLCLPNHPGEFHELELLPDPETYWQTIESFRGELEAVGGTSLMECTPLEASGACGAGGGVLSLAANGDLYPCQCLHHAECRLGNVQEDSIAAIVKTSPVLTEFLGNGWPWFRECGDCPLVQLCASTCRVFQRVFRADEALFHDRLCPFFKREVEDRLWRQVNKAVSEGNSYPGAA